MKHSLLIILICLAVSGVSSAQTSGSALPVTYNNFLSNNLFNPEKLSVRQSFSMSYLSSGSGSLFSNTYRNSMSYKLSEKLLLNLDLAYRFTPSQFNSYSPLQGEGRNQGLFIPSFGIKYQPGSSFMIEFQYNRIDPYDYYGNGIWRRQY